MDGPQPTAMVFVAGKGISSLGSTWIGGGGAAAPVAAGPVAESAVSAVPVAEVAEEEEVSGEAEVPVAEEVCKR